MRRIGASAFAQKFSEIVSWSAENRGPRSASTVLVSFSAAIITPVPAANPAKMPGRARAAGKIAVRLDPTLRMLLAPTSEMDPSAPIAVPARAIAGTMDDALESTSPMLDASRVRFFAPLIVAIAAPTLARDDFATVRWIGTKRGRETAAIFADAAPVSASALTVASASRSSSLSSIRSFAPAARSAATRTVASRSESCRLTFASEDLSSSGRTCTAAFAVFSIRVSALRRSSLNLVVSGRTRTESRPTCPLAMCAPWGGDGDADGSRQPDRKPSRRGPASRTDTVSTSVSVFFLGSGRG